MNVVNRRAVVGLVQLFIALPALVFLPAWTLNYWQAWVCLAVFFAAVTAITLYLMKADPALLARRMKAGAVAEQERSQKIIQSLAAGAFVAVFVVPALDHRYGWSRAPAYAAVGGDLLILAGFTLVFFVFRENSFTSGVIEVATEQRVITAGPYAHVRHPMYLGSLVMLLGIPLGLGSLCGVFVIFAMTAVIVWRLIKEEEFLEKHLPGYVDYIKSVKYRLVPFVW